MQTYPSDQVNKYKADHNFGFCVQLVLPKAEDEAVQNPDTR
jgi:hypothetical protein